jgi:hypothetical protein
MNESATVYRVWVETPGRGEPGFLEIKGKIDFATRKEAEKEIAKLTSRRRIGKTNFTFTVVAVDLGPMHCNQDLNGVVCGRPARIITVLSTFHGIGQIKICDECRAAHGWDKDVDALEWDDAPDKPKPAEVLYGWRFRLNDELERKFANWSKENRDR